MSYDGESAAEALERQQREAEADAFLANLTPSIVNRATSPQLQVAGGTRRGPATQTIVSGPSTTTTRSIAASQGNKDVLNSLTTNLQRMEAEEKRQEALRRIKATHRSVNTDSVIVCDSKPNGSSTSQSTTIKPRTSPVSKPAPPKANGGVKSDSQPTVKPALPFAATVYGAPKKSTNTSSSNTNTDKPKATVQPAQTATKSTLPFAATVYGQTKKPLSSPEVPKESSPDNTDTSASHPKASSPATIIKKPNPPAATTVNKAKTAFETKTANEPAKTISPNGKQSIPAKPQPPSVKQPEPPKPQPPAVKQPEPPKPQPPAAKQPEPPKPQPPAAKQPEPPKPQPPAVKQPEPPKPQPPSVKQPEPPKPQPPAVKQPEPPKPQPPAVKQPEPPKPQPPAVKQSEPPKPVVKQPEPPKPAVKQPEPPKPQPSTGGNSTVATRKIGDQTTVVTCKPGFENLKATKFLASGRGPQETGSKGTLGSSFKGDLTNRLKGSTSLVKTEEELLEGKKKKVQLGRVLDDPPKEPEPVKSNSSPAVSKPSPVVIPPALKAQPIQQVVPKPPTPEPTTIPAATSDPPATTGPAPPPAPPLPPVGAPAAPAPAQDSTDSGPPAVVPPPPPPPPVGFVPPKKPMTDPSMASSGSKGAKPAVSKPQQPDMAAMFQAELMSKLKKKE